MYDPIKVGQRLRAARRNQNLTQYELAQRLKMDQSYISSIESGRREGSAQTLLSFSQELGISLSSLTDQPDDEERLALPDDAPQGLRELVEDVALSGALGLSTAEVSDLATFRPVSPMEKNGYLQALIALRTSRG